MVGMLKMLWPWQWIEMPQTRRERVGQVYWARCCTVIDTWL